MDILLCPVCGHPLERVSGGVGAVFDCAAGCRALDPEAWVRARWEQMNPDPEPEADPEPDLEPEPGQADG